jgi:multidrug resistance efflux pump
VPVILVVVLVGGWWILTRLAEPGAGPKGSGFTEADEVFLSAQTAALVREVPVEVGARVSPGTVVARLDDAAIQLQLRLADPISRQSLELDADKFVIRSPLAGVVTRVPAHVGEQALPGRVLVAVANTSQLNVSLSVSLRDLAAVRVGQPVQVTVDALPDRSFAGTVRSINANAEFTPRNVQTESDRLNLVYGVTARVDNRDGLLKPGMPASATFLVQP